MNFTDPGRTGLVAGEGVRRKHRDFNHFLYHALKGQQSAIMGLRVGSGLPNVQKTGLLDFKIQLPATHPEQTASQPVAVLLNESEQRRTLQVRYLHEPYP